MRDTWVNSDPHEAVVPYGMDDPLQLLRNGPKVGTSSTLCLQHAIFFQLAIESLITNMQYLGGFLFVILRLLKCMLN